MKLWLLIAIACTGVVLFLLPKTSAHTKPFKTFKVENKRTHTRQNYVLQKGRKDEMSERMDAIGPAYARRSFEPDYPEDLPQMIVDYANMIKNDIILLDNSVETRTPHKRGNVKKMNNAIPELPCSCESFRQVLDLGPNHIPQLVESRNCSKGSCPLSYRCKEKNYEITVLKLKSYIEEVGSLFEMPEDLSDNWLAKQINVAVGCVCARDSDN